LADIENIERPIAVVTGANGFIGQHVSDTLQSAGWNVRRVVRNRANGVTKDYWVIPNLARQASELDDVMRGATAVIHLAGLAHMLKRKPSGYEFHVANVALTEAVMNAAARQQVGSVVFMSSAAVTMAPNAGSVGSKVGYAETKRQAEQIVTAIAANHDMRIWVLRPPLVYGPGMKGNPLRLFRLIARGIPLPVGGVRNRRSFLYVGNLADAVVAAVACRREGGVYEIADRPALSTEQFARHVAKGLGVPLRLIPMPRALLGAAGTVGEVLRILRLPVPGREDIKRLTGSYELDGEKFHAVTGYTQRTAIAEAMIDTATWFRNRNRSDVPSDAAPLR
jgi:nucleoside-diphosphate-sugar epimerase